MTPRAALLLDDAGVVVEIDRCDGRAGRIGDLLNAAAQGVVLILADDRGIGQCA